MMMRDANFITLQGFIVVVELPRVPGLQSFKMTTQKRAQFVTNSRFMFKLPLLSDRTALIQMREEV